MKHGYATERFVRDMQQELIRSGRITEKEFRRQRNKHKKNSKKSRDTDLNNRIFKLIKQGKTIREIAAELNFSENYIYIRMQQIFKQKGLSKEQIRSLRYGKILELLKNGITPQEIANFLGISSESIYNRQEEFIRDGTLTKEQLKEYRTKRIQEFAETRRKAIEECKEDSKICVSRKKFFELAQAEISYGNALEKADVKMLGRCIIYNDIFLTKENLKLVVIQYVIRCEPQEINGFFKSLIMLYGDTDYGNAIKEFKKYATEKIRERKSKFSDITEER